MHPPAGGGKGRNIVAEMPTFQMTIRPDPAQAVRLGEAFARFAEAHKVPAAVRRSVAIALDELLSNSFAHGSAGAVDIQAELRSDRLSVTLSDDGKPFNPLDLEAPDTGLPIAERPVGGLGIHLVRQIVDEVNYLRRDDRNVVTLAKLLH